MCRRPPHRYVAALALLVLSACAQPRELTDRERAFVQAAQQAWAETSFPAPTLCDWSATVMRVGQCRSAYRDDVAGCMELERVRPFAGLRHPVITVGLAYVADEKLRAHELVHALCSCAGYVCEGNFDHSNPLLWQDRGGDASVQGRILAIVSGELP